MKILKNFWKYMLFWFLGFFWLFLSSVFAQWRFEGGWDIFSTDSAQSVVKSSIWNMDYNTKPFYGASFIDDFIVDFLVKYVIPVFLVVAVLVAIFGFYKTMFSVKDWDEVEWAKYIIWWVVGIIVMQSAAFIASNYADMIIALTPTSQLNSLPESIYNLIIYPFIQMFMYIIVWVLFVVLLLNVIKFITSADEKVVTHSRNIIVNNIIWIAVIMLAKEIVQFVYGKQEALKTSSDNLWDVWTSLLTPANIKLIYDIINWALSIISFIILVIIIYQSYLLLLTPTDEKQIATIRRNFLYIFIWLVLIWFCYLIVNLLLVN